MVISQNLKSLLKPCFLISLLFTFSLFAQDEIDTQKQELQKTREQLKEVQDRLKSLDEEEKGVLGRIDALEQKVFLTQKLINNLKKVANSTEKEITNIRVSIQNTESKINTRTKDLESRLVNLYKYGRLFPLEVLLSARSMPDVYKRMVYLRFIAQDDQSVMQELSTLIENLEQQRKKLNTQLDELARLSEEREREKKSLKTSLDLETKLLKKVRTTKDEKRTMELELQESSAKLEKLIAELEIKRREQKLNTGTNPLETSKGNLPWPYQGKITASFGSQVHPKYKTRTRNTGIDIECPKGSLVSAIAAGRVVYADRFMGYGNLVIVDHGNGYYSLYSNLSEMFVGVGGNVEPGQRIAKVDENLHFELRKEGQPVDPLEWLSK
jgi:murein hydrolase activator